MCWYYLKLYSFKFLCVEFQTSMAFFDAFSQVKHFIRPFAKWQAKNTCFSINNSKILINPKLFWEINEFNHRNSSFYIVLLNYHGFSSQFYGNSRERNCFRSNRRGFSSKNSHFLRNLAKVIHKTKKMYDSVHSDAIRNYFSRKSILTDIKNLNILLCFDNITTKKYY